MADEPVPEFLPCEPLITGEQWVEIARRCDEVYRKMLQEMMLPAELLGPAQPSSNRAGVPFFTARKLDRLPPLGHGDILMLGPTEYAVIRNVDTGMPMPQMPPIQMREYVTPIDDALLADAAKLPDDLRARLVATQSREWQYRFHREMARWRRNQPSQDYGAGTDEKGAP